MNVQFFPHNENLFFLSGQAPPPLTNISAKNVFFWDGYPKFGTLG